MKPRTEHFAVCVDNAGNEASLVLRKIYRILPDAQAARDGLVRIIDESGEDYLFDETQFVFVDLPQAISKKIFALQKAG